MKDGASCTIHKHHSNLPNGNHYHHVEAKAFESIGVKERLYLRLFLTARALSIMISSLKIVNKETYINILHRRRVAVRKKRPEKWRTNSWFIFHDNAPAHRSVFVKDSIAKNDVTILERSPYLPWLQLIFACTRD
jgi:hypothetical protein